MVFEKQSLTARRNEEYAPSFGFVNFKQFLTEVNEFGRLDSEDKQVLLAKSVNVRKWLHSSINERVSNVFVAATFKNGENLTDFTAADLWIVKSKTELMSWLRRKLH